MPAREPEQALERVPVLVRGQALEQALEREQALEQALEQVPRQAEAALHRLHRSLRASH